MPGVNGHPPIPPTSTHGTPTFRGAADRHCADTTFDNDLQESADGASGYHRTRPGYPPAAIGILAHLAPRSRVVVDIGVGTGGLTTSLTNVYRDATLLVLDPSTTMRQALMHSMPTAECLDGTTERMRLGSDSIDVATYTQTWHWVDPTATSREFARMLRADGVAMLVWNTLDVSIPWVHRFSRIMHTGDVLRLGFCPKVGPELELVDEVRLTWEQTLTIEDTVLLARTHSYWLRSEPTTCAKVETNLHWYLHEHLEHTYEEGTALPYRRDAFYFRVAQIFKLPNRASQFSFFDLG